PALKTSDLNAAARHFVSTVPAGRKVSIRKLVATTLSVPQPIASSSHMSITETPPIPAALRDATITEHHRELAAAVMDLLPSQCRTNVQSFSILYSGAKYRGLGGKTTIILDGSV